MPAATTTVTMPVLGLTMEEGTVAEWLKQVGDTVARDEPLLTVEMDKGTVEVPAPVAGVLTRILVEQGVTVVVRTPIAEISDPSAAAEAPEPGSTGVAVAGGPGDLPARAPKAEPTTSQPTAVASTGTRTGTRTGTDSDSGSGASSGGGSDGARGQRLLASPRARMRARELGIDLLALAGSGPNGRIVEADVLAARAAPAVADGQRGVVTPAAGERLVATPVARRLAQEHGVDIERVQGSGPGGRITQDDVLQAAEAARRRTTPAAGVTQATESVTQATAGVTQATAGLVPMSRLRRITAERMAASAQAAARVTLFLDADFEEAARFRSQLQPEFARLGVAKLPWDVLIAKAAGLALVEHPALHAQWADGTNLHQSPEINVGVAVTLEPEGLVVPVLRQAATRTLRELAADLLALADQARAGRLRPADMQGGSFTITNLGAYRVDGFTPIINPPETAILGVGRIAQRAVVVGGNIEPRTMCTLSLSFDHRVVDGAPAAAFLARVAELLERPYALLGI